MRASTWNSFHRLGLEVLENRLALASALTRLHASLGIGVRMVP